MNEYLASIKNWDAIPKFFGFVIFGYMVKFLLLIILKNIMSYKSANTISGLIGMVIVILLCFSPLW